MLEDILLPIGSLVKATPTKDETKTYMIVGRRIINHESLRAWDYISVPFEDGLSRTIQKDMKTFENFFYFNHFDIEEIVFRFAVPEGQLDSTPLDT
jgi:hypothetical protein